MRVPLLFVVLMSLVAVSSAHAQSEALRAERESLTEYRGERPLRTIAQLGGRQLSGQEAQEAKYLRVHVAIDFLVMAARRGDESLAERVAEAYGAAGVETLRAQLRRDLEFLQAPPFDVVASESLRALDLLDGAAPRADRGIGTREGILVLKAVRNAITARDGSTISALAALAADPCPTGEGCRPAFAPFDALGRRAMHAIVRAQHIVERLREADAGGDPLVRRLGGMIARDRSRVAFVELRPSSRLEVDLVEVNQNAPSAEIDTVVLVGPRTVSFGRVPRVTIEDGVVTLAQLSGPVLPAMESVRLRGRVSERPRAIDDVVAMLRGAGDLGRVGIATTRRVRSFIFTRAVLSVREASGNPMALVARGPDGGLRSVRVDYRRPSERGPRSRVQLFVRMAGFELRSRRGRRDVNGFDFERLGNTIPHEQGDRALIRAMSGALSEIYVPSAFVLAALDMPLTYQTL